MGDRAGGRSHGGLSGDTLELCAPQIQVGGEAGSRAEGPWCQGKGVSWHSLATAQEGRGISSHRTGQNRAEPGGQSRAWGSPLGSAPPSTTGIQALGRGTLQRDAQDPDYKTPLDSLPPPPPAHGAGSAVPQVPRADPGVPQQYLGRAHCCLQVESLRILLLAEQALREGLEEALARRSPLALALSCPGSVPFMHTALGSPLPRLCPFCPASSSGTCPAREQPQ